MSEYPDLETRELALASLLAQHPNGAVGAISDEGLFMSIPESLPLTDHVPIEARSMLEVVVPSDHVKIIAWWEQARSEGSSWGITRLNSGEGVIVQAIDVRERHGAYVVVLSAEEGGVTQPTKSLGRVAVKTLPRIARTTKDAGAVITSIDDGVTKLLGWTREEMVGTRSLEYIHPDDQERAIGNWMEMLASPATSHRWRGRHKRQDGGWTWFEFINTNDLDGEDGRVRCEMVDISEEMSAVEALGRSEHLLRQLAETLPVGVLQCDTDRQVVYTNSTLHDILLSPAAATVDAQLAAVVDDDRALVDDALAAVLDEGRDGDIEVRLRLPGSHDLRLVSVRLCALVEPEGAVTGAIACVSDVTESVRMRDELRDRATYDVLTQCHNRSSVMSELGTMLAMHAGRNSTTAAIFVDLDRFKQVNDLLGHAAGDELLVHVAEALRSVVRGDDVVGRLGGDEFLVLCPGSSGPDEALKVAGRIAEVVHRDIEIAGTSVELRASIGVACSSDDHRDADSLVAEADLAMYESKRQGACQPVLFASPMRRYVAGAASPERLLRRALDHGELAVHYQPIVELRSGTPKAYEALLRWWRDGRLVVAGEFIDLAEQTGLIHDIGAWVLDEVCREAARPCHAASDLRWAVNLSPLQVAARGLAGFIEEALARHGTSPRSIVAELTEHQTLGDSPVARATLHELHELGVRIALDDFGTGWSSLELVRTLPVDFLKVDRTFTAALETEPAASHITATVLDLGRRLGAHVVVEGIETKGQRRHLLGLGATLGQGYLYSRALSPEELFADRLPEAAEA